MVWNILLIIVILVIVSVYGIAIFKVVCYILTERRVRRLEKTVNDLPQKLNDVLKRNNDDRGNLQ
jgi:Flp pilus assembly protein TadB